MGSRASEGNMQPAASFEMPEGAPCVDFGALVPAALAAELRTEMLDEIGRPQTLAQMGGGEFGGVTARPARHHDEEAVPQIGDTGDVERDHMGWLGHAGASVGQLCSLFVL
jgi:hypothetical protein